MVMLQVTESRTVATRGSAEIVGKVTQSPSWRKRPVPGSRAFEPVLEAVVTLAGGRGWTGPVVVHLNVTRVDVGEGAAGGLGVEVAVRDAMLKFLYRSDGREHHQLGAMRLHPPRGDALAALKPFGESERSGPASGLPPLAHFSDNRDVRCVTGQKRLSKGQEVEYVGEERTPRLEPFGTASEIWVESEESQTHDDVYLFSCRMRDGRWEMSQPGYGRHFKPRTN
jgi:hypothetical protein